MQKIPVTLVENKRAKRIHIKIHLTKGILIVIPDKKYAKIGIKNYEENKEKCIKIYNKLQEKHTIKKANGIPTNWDNFDTIQKKEYYKNLKQKAIEYLPQRLQYLSQKYEFSYSGIKINHTKRSWGRCSKNRVISLNINIMRLNKDEIDFILLHELTHLIHFNHSPKFHDYLNNLCILEIGKKEKELIKQIKEYIII